jgi:hypothetical protein
MLRMGSARPRPAHRVRALVLLLAGAAALVVSFVVTPTPDTFMVLSNGRRSRTGAVALLAGAYLTYRA